MKSSATAILYISSSVTPLFKTSMYNPTMRSLTLLLALLLPTPPLARTPDDPIAFEVASLKPSGPRSPLSWARRSRRQ